MLCVCPSIHSRKFTKIGGDLWEVCGLDLEFLCLYFLLIFLGLENTYGLEAEIVKINDALGQDSKYECKEETDYKYGYHLQKK